MARRSSEQSQTRNGGEQDTIDDDIGELLWIEADWCDTLDSLPDSKRCEGAKSTPRNCNACTRSSKGPILAGMHRPILLLSNNAPLGLKVVYCLRAAGYPVDILSTRKGNYCRFSRYAGEFSALDAKPSDDLADVIVEWINGNAAVRSWAAVIADDVRAHGLLNRVSARLRTPSFAPTPAQQLSDLHDKWKFYCRIRAAGIDAPDSWLLQSAGDLNGELTQQLKFPLLVKPLNAESSHGIVRFASIAPLREYLETPGPYKQFPLKLQRFIVGHTIGVSLLADKGRILSHDVQLHADDGSRTFYADAQALDAAQRIVAEYGYGGPGHIDFVRDDVDKRLYALEFNCRFWYSTTVSAWRGGNFPAMATEIAQGRSVQPHPTLPGAYFQPGTVVRMGMRHPGRLLNLDRQNWRGFWQAISDPLPHLVNLWRNR